MREERDGGQIQWNTARFTGILVLETREVQTLEIISFLILVTWMGSVSSDKVPLLCWTCLPLCHSLHVWNCNSIILQ